MRERVVKMRSIGGILTVGILLAGASHAAFGDDAILAQDIDFPSTGSSEDRALIGALRSAARGEGDAPEIVIDYPLDESIFPPDMIAPRFLWHDPVLEADRWLIDMSLKGGQARICVLTESAPVPDGEIDPECVGATNEVYTPTSYQASARTWMPDDRIWATIKENSAEQTARVTIIGFNSASPDRPLSHGVMTMKTSEDPVGAPIFYRDVPLMPSETEEGVIKPLATHALPLVAWRLRDISRRDSRVVLKDMPTCANCHSFSADGGKLGMDMDGPDGDKGAYALASIRATMKITHDEIISWNAFEDKPEGHRTIGFLSQISPDGQYAVTTLNEEVYVANFTNYKFLQVFYPTRGILSYYSAKTQEMKALPGADDPAYVHCDPAWSPDGKTIVFSRGEARDSYIKGAALAAYPNDPAETPMQYDLYRMPFNEGRGGEAAPIEGASANGMSNTFPKVSPDGKFIVFVKCANGQLMRPDGRLWIVPMEGGEARLMRCNTSLMNSWHSFSPNGRWMVFSSKVNTPYTQMFLTHLDEEGESSPPLLIPDSTAANRAVNIPEFVNISYDDLVTIEAPSVEHYRRFNRALTMINRNQWEEAIATLREALELAPDSVKTHILLGTALSRVGRAEEGIAHYEKAIDLDPGRVDAHYNLSFALFVQGRNEEAIARFKAAFGLVPRWGRIGEEYDLGIALPVPGDPWQVATLCRARLGRSRSDLWALVVMATFRGAADDVRLRNGEEGVQIAKHACLLTRFQVPETLDVLAGAYAEAGRFDEAVRLAEFTLWFARNAEREKLIPGAEQRLALYKEGKPFRRAN